MTKSLRIAPQADIPVPQFGIAAGESPLLAMAMQRIAESVFQMIRNGIVDRSADSAVQFDALESAVAAHLADAMSGGGLRMDLQWMKRMTGDRTPDDFDAAAWKSYVASHLQWCDRMKLGKTIYLHPVYAKQAEAEKAIVAAGGEVPARVKADAKGLALAWSVAQDNLARAEFRIAAGFTLLNAARGKRPSAGKTAESQADALMHRLWTERLMMENQLFAVGVLVGDAARELLLARAKAKYGPGFSVMPLVTQDSHTPGRWSVADEDRLRADIERA